MAPGRERSRLLLASVLAGQLETRHAGMYLQTALRMEYLFFGWGRCGVFFAKPACSRLASEIPTHLFS